ncbi:LysE family translocator [Nocardia pseudobrasiliensis]|uniref:Threonine/homoserine/homoserine lactone efflux protein n=1 Tax=Nocardia pseudobrasiliensis TaxID=45979 RepID=A0A370I5Y2_9NOCA|nr:LysE family translocator [Nocardia pseudobrasiliensis]RDI66040.1 threonine/homoserine/homoserine lactone efflux protein [Nocardia pseudobrasiliensis]
MSVSLLLGFIGVCVVLSLTPGPDSFLVLRYSVVGRRPAIASAIGSAVGGIGWTIVVAAGVAALLEQSATAYRVVKVIGGIYLVYLGIRTLIEQRRARVATAEDAPVRRSVSMLSAFTAGLLSTLLNPKVGLFYLAVLPQFLIEATFVNTLTLGAIESFVAAIEMVLLALAAARLAGLLRQQRIRDRLERISAGILAALGIGTVVSAS